MVSDETTKECNDVDLSYKKTLILKETKSRDSDDEYKNNFMLLTLAVPRGQYRAACRSHWRESPVLKKPRATITSGERQRCWRS